jgi:hypothetical protein
MLLVCDPAMLEPVDPDDDPWDAHGPDMAKALELVRAGETVVPVEFREFDDRPFAVKAVLRVDGEDVTFQGTVLDDDRNSVHYAAREFGSLLARGCRSIGKRARTVVLDAPQVA